MRVSKRIIIGLTVVVTLMAGYGIARGRAIDSYYYGYDEHMGYSYISARASSTLDYPFILNSTETSAHIQTESGVSYL